ncbi:MAG: phosphoglycerate kinase [Alphaproteobacteria bacterium]|nr:MAG: phosphoglycerate kinase [Alphaproteobacteria bacterium]
MSAFKTLDDVDVKGKRVLVRVDLNVPMADGKVTDTTRIDRVVPTLTELSDKGAKVILMAHFGRPKGAVVPEMSLKPVAEATAAILSRPVAFAGNCIGEEAATAVATLADGDLLMLENARFHKGEEANDPEFAKALAANGDIYVNDAFSVSHRAHASSEGLAHLLPAYAGRSMEAELRALDAALGNPQRPVLAVVGGAKVSTKLDLLENLVGKVDRLVIGGGMANTFLAAMGKPVGKSLCEHDLGDTARRILEAAKAAGCEVILPKDVVVAKEFKAGADARCIPLDAVADDDMILDVGTDSLGSLAVHMEDTKTVVWNGPLGAFEIPPFDNGTVTAARQVAMLTKAGRLTSVAGGGDTLAALNQAGASDDFSYISTAGGAFLEWLEGKELPGVKALSAS